MDRTAAIIRIDDLHGASRAVAFVYGCHPTVLGVENLLISADFPGPAVETIENGLNGGFAIFFNGAEGNVSIGRSPELSAVGLQTPNRTFARAAELGSQLGGAVLAALPSISTSERITVAAAVLNCLLAGRPYPPVPALEAALKEAQSRTQPADDQTTSQGHELQLEKLYASIRWNNARRLLRSEGQVALHLQALRISDAFFLGIPAEVFSETGLAIKRMLGYRTFVIGLANGYEGYIPSESAYQEGGYEVEASYCGSDSERRLVEGSLQLYRQLFPAKGAA